MRSRRPTGRYTVTGPHEEDHPVPSVGAGISVAQTLATRQRARDDVLSYYVRDFDGTTLAMVTKEEDGSITTRAHSAFTNYAA